MSNCFRCNHLSEANHSVQSKDKHTKTRLQSHGICRRIFKGIVPKDTVSDQLSIARYRNPLSSRLHTLFLIVEIVDVSSRFVLIVVEDANQLRDLQ